MMSLQFISDSKGETTGVFIPIKEWNDLKTKFKGIEEEEIGIPEWHKDILQQRLSDYTNKNVQAIDFDDAINDIEADL